MNQYASLQEKRSYSWKKEFAEQLVFKSELLVRAYALTLYQQLIENLTVKLPCPVLIAVKKK